MASYKWIDRAQPERSVPLDEVDKVGAEALGAALGAMRQYESGAAEFGMAILMSGGYTVGEWTPGRAGTLLKETCPPATRADVNKLCDAVFSKYDFQAWR